MIIGNSYYQTNSFHQLLRTHSNESFIVVTVMMKAAVTSMIPGYLFKISKFLFVLFSYNFYCLKFSFLKSKWRITNEAWLE